MTLTTGAVSAQQSAVDKPRGVRHTRPATYIVIVGHNNCGRECLVEVELGTMLCEFIQAWEVTCPHCRCLFMVRAGELSVWQWFDHAAAVLPAALCTKKAK